MKTRQGPLFIHFEKPRPAQAPEDSQVTTMMVGEEASDALPPEPEVPALPEEGGET